MAAISECESEPAQELSGRDSWRRTETGSSSAIRTRDARQGASACLQALGVKPSQV
ncbi:unnamed protein product [Effrenium voratum]|nr:unnamed protein product [Effrenium voratum]